jgi:Flp pilus assembly protein TadB
VAKERGRVSFSQLVRSINLSFPHLMRSLAIGVFAFVILVLATALAGIGGFLIAVFFIAAAFWGMRRGRRTTRP